VLAGALAFAAGAVSLAGAQPARSPITQLVVRALNKERLVACIAIIPIIWLGYFTSALW
jgi:hypothetical protein